MKKMTTKIQGVARLLAGALLTGTLLTGCYQEEHFDFTGPFEIDQRVPDTLPFPFDETKQDGEWLMKDGVHDYGKILIKGYTDYYAVHDTTSWGLFPDGMQLIPTRKIRRSSCRERVVQYV